MRATIKNYIDGAQKRREEGDEKGFSLIELIVVVAILGILVAVAIPVFGAIQQNAKDESLKNAASSGAVVVAAELAAGRTDTIDALLASSSTDDYTLTDASTGTNVDDACVSAVGAGALDGAAPVSVGPGCP